MKTLFLFILIAIVTAACNNNVPSNIEGNRDNVKINTPVVKDSIAPKPDHSTAKNSLDVFGIYKGVIPCADCNGIETEVILNKDNSYVLSQQYLGKGSNKIFKKEGKWSWDGEFNILLEGHTDGPNKYFVSENKLLQLDMTGSKIEGALADKYILRKQ